jgi:hypothetical protein
MLMVAVMVVAGAIADFINLPGIVGAFLAGLAVNSQFAAKLPQGDVDYAFAVLICGRLHLSGYRRPKSAALRTSIGGRS